jgi:hypothetical protein
MIKNIYKLAATKLNFEKYIGFKFNNFIETYIVVSKIIPSVLQVFHTQTLMNIYKNIFECIILWDGTCDIRDVRRSTRVYQWMQENWW